MVSKKRSNASRRDEEELSSTTPSKAPEGQPLSAKNKTHQDGRHYSFTNVVLLATALIAVVSALCAVGSGPLSGKGSVPSAAAVRKQPIRHLHWEKIVSAEGPSPRLAHAVAVVGSERMYVHGGLFGFANVTMSDLWVFDDASEAWSPVQQSGDRPSPRFHHSMVSADDKELLLFGGFNVFNTDPSHDSLDDLFAFEIGAGDWRRLIPPSGSPQPTKRAAHDAVWYRGSMYVFGGWQKIGLSGHDNELWRFHRASVTWTSLTPDPAAAAAAKADYPTGRFGFAWASIDEHLYLYGGGCAAGSHESERGGQCSDMWRYTPESDRWTHLQAASGDHPSPRRATHADASFAGHMYLFGGVHIDASHKPPKVTMYDDFHVYDPEANAWSNLEIGRDEIKPPKTFGHSVAALRSHVVVFGGRAEVPTSPGTNQLWRFHLQSSE